jgi:hypothetical protein
MGRRWRLARSALLISAIVAAMAAWTGQASGRASGAALGSVRAGRDASHAPTVRSGRVRDITLHVDPQRLGLGAYSDTWGNNLVFDKNHDGIPDILLSNHMQPWAIWLGNGAGGFTFDQDLPQADRHHCAAADFGGLGGTPPDGRLDLYCVNGADYGRSDDKSNSLFIQRADGGFDDEVTSWDVVDPSGRGRTTSILHIAGRPPSLFVGNAKSIRYPSLDHIFVNQGGDFVEANTAGLPSEQGTSCSGTGDFNRDGRQDLLTCSFSPRLYENLSSPVGGVAYREVARAEGIPSAWVADAQLVDLNHDGWPDLVMLRKHSLTVRLNQHRTPYFSKVSFRYPLVAGHHFCVGRANSDTTPDLLVVQGLRYPTDKIQQPDWMLINSGSGSKFTALPVPQPPLLDGANGNGDTCTAIPHYDGERAAWTINNGYGGSRPGSHPGYRQLVIYTR